MPRSSFLPPLLLAFACCFATATAQAHGDAAPRHGGVVRSAGDLSFEIASGDERTTVYIEDHGEPVSSAGFKGRLTVSQSGVTTESVLKPDGANTLVAQVVRPAAGAKLVVVIVTPQNKTLALRFTLR